MRQVKTKNARTKTLAIHMRCDVDNFGDERDDYFADTMKPSTSAVSWRGIAACLVFWAVIVWVML